MKRQQSDQGAPDSKRRKIQEEEEEDAEYLEEAVLSDDDLLFGGEESSVYTITSQEVSSFLDQLAEDKYAEQMANLSPVFLSHLQNILIGLQLILMVEGEKKAVKDNKIPADEVPSEEEMAEEQLDSFQKAKASSVVLAAHVRDIFADRRTEVNQLVANILKDFATYEPMQEEDIELSPLNTEDRKNISNFATSLWYECDLDSNTVNQQRFFDQALELINQVISNKSVKDAPVFLYFALNHRATIVGIYSSKKDEAAAIKDIATSNSLGVHNVITFSYQTLSQIYVKNNKPKEALDALTKGITINPKDVQCFILRASLYENQLNDFESARKDYTAALLLERNAGTLLKRAALYINKLAKFAWGLNDIDDALDLETNPEAVEEMEEFVKLHFHFDAFGIKGQALHHICEAMFFEKLVKDKMVHNEYKQAIELLKQDNTIDKELLSLALCKRAIFRNNVLDEHELCLQDLTQALEYDPTNVEALIEEALVVLQFRNDTTQCFANVTKAVELVEKNPSHYSEAVRAQAYNARGYCYQSIQNIKNVDKSLEDYLKASELIGHSNILYLESIGFLYDEEKNDKENAMKFYDMAVEKGSNNPQLLLSRAKLHRLNGDEDLARADEILAQTIESGQIREAEDEEEDEE